MSRDYTAKENIEEIVEIRARRLHTAQPGEIETYDPTKSKATVRLSVRHRVNGTEVDYPILVEVPVVMPRAGGFNISMPLKKGDGVLVIFAERSLENWVAAGAVSDTGGNRAHDLSDAVAIPGLQSFNKAPTNGHPDNFVIGKEDGSIELVIKPAGTIHLGTAAASQPAMQFFKFKAWASAAIIDTPAGPGKFNTATISDLDSVKSAKIFLE